MARKLKDPRRHAEAELIATLRAQTKAKRLERAVIKAENVREVYLRELQVPGATLSTVAAKYGVTKQAVHAATAGFERERARHRARDLERRPALKREHRCRACGEVGHNARRPHDEQGKLIEDGGA